MRLQYIKPGELSEAQHALYERFDKIVEDDAYRGGES